MNRLIVLDAGPLGLASRSRGKPDADLCLDWLEQVRQAGNLIGVPEIARYEVRRELVRTGATAGLRRLDAIQAASLFLPIEGRTMDRAGDLWALVRRAGKPTAPDLALDGDAILAAQSLLAAESGYDAIVATTNVAHLIRFPGVDARAWWTVG